MENFEIRNTTLDDYMEILKIYDRARKFMVEHDNPRQWNTVWPPSELVKEDIELGRNYVCTLNGKIEAVFVYLEGEDPTYIDIVDGSWLDDSSYGVIHRLAVSGNVKGAATFVMDWAYEKLKHLRVDTHEDNYVMQNLLKKLGFVRTGTIFVREDHDPRFAYEKSEKL